MEREAFLQRLRERLPAARDGAIAGLAAAASPAAAVPPGAVSATAAAVSATAAAVSDPAAAMSPDRAAVLALFVERLDELGAEARVLASWPAARSAVELLVAERGWQSVACAPGLRWPGIAAQWTAEPRDAALGLCAADAAVAETGSVVVYGSAEVCRGYSLVPPAAGFFVPASRVVSRLGDVLRALPGGPGAMPSCVSMISGPSGTSDIAATHVTGVHGPGEVFIWVIVEADAREGVTGGPDASAR